MRNARHALILAIGGLGLLGAAPAFADFSPTIRPYHVKKYGIGVTLDAKTGEFKSFVAITLVPSQTTSTIELDSEHLKIMAVKMGETGGGVPVNHTLGPETATGQILTLTLPAPAPADQPLTLHIAATGKAQAGADLGLISETDPDHSDRVIYYTMFEPNGARRLFPCDDTPADKAVIDLSVTVDSHLQVIGNGTKVSDDPIELDGEKVHRVVWHEDHPLPPYLVAFAAGPFDPAKKKAAVPIAVDVGDDEEPLAATALTAASKGIDFMSDFLDTPFPFKKYDQVAIPEFLWNGMENASATFERSDAVLLPTAESLLQQNDITDLVDHELAHQWFGDLVTLRWWNDTWLNEAFATYLGALAAADYTKTDASRVDFALAVRDRYFRAEDGPRSRPVISASLPTAEDAFDSISYLKGASVLRMLETQMGREKFRAGMKAYLKDYAYGNATSADFFASMQGAGASNLTAFEKGWLEEPGYPVLKLSHRWLGGDKQLAITVDERPNKGGRSKSFYPGVLKVVAHRRSDPTFDLVINLPVEQAHATIAAPLPAEPEWLDWNQGDTFLAKLEVTEPEGELSAEALKDPDPLARLWAQLDFAGGLVDAESKKAPSGAALNLLSQAITTDHSPYVRAGLMHELAIGPARKLPTQLGEAVISQAASPSGLGSDDPAGSATVRNQAMELLGKVDDPAAMSMLEKAIRDPNVSPDIIQGVSAGLALKADSHSISLLTAALQSQGKRGVFYHRAVLNGLATSESDAVLDPLASELRRVKASSELVVTILRGLYLNRAISKSNAYPAFVSAVVSNADLNEEVRANAVGLLDDVKSSSAKSELMKMAKSSNAHIAGLAHQTLQKNFGVR